MREPHFRLVTLPGDAKDDVGASPLALVSYEAEIVVDNVPTDRSSWNELRDLDGAAVYVLVAVLEFPECVGPPVNCFRPPAAHVVDRVEGRVGRGVHLESRAVILALCHSIGPI